MRAIRFMTGNAEIPFDQRLLLQDVASQLLFLIQAATGLGKIIQIEVRGNRDPAGTSERNAALSRSRAENVPAALVIGSARHSHNCRVGKCRERTCSSV